MATPAGVKHAFYGITPAGDLHWHQLVGGADGSPRWSQGSGSKVGSGFHVYQRVFSPGFQGILYGVKPNGALHIHIHEPADTPTPVWHPTSGRLISEGWNGLSPIVPVSNTFYGAKPDGDVLWYRVDNWSAEPPTGSALTTGRLVLRDWQQFTTVIGTLVDTGKGDGGTAVFYGLRPNGDLFWTRHDGWMAGEPALSGGYGWRQIGNGWGAFRLLMTGYVPGGAAVIYGLTHDGYLLWFRHDGALAGSPTWTAGAGGRRVGFGFDRYASVVCGHHRAYDKGGEGPLERLVDDVLKLPPRKRPPF